VKYLVSPLLYCSYLDALGPFGGYHGGIGFTNLNTNRSFTMNYDADPLFVSAIIPDIITYPNGTKDIYWQNFGKVFVYESINYTYWHSVSQPVGRMTGAQLKNFLNVFVSVVNDTYPFYNIWRVYDHFGGNILIDNFECFSFVFNCFYEIQKFGGYIKPNLTLNVSYLTAFSGSVPEKVDYKDPVVRKQIINFYETLEGKIGDMGIMDFILELIEIALYGDFYIRSSDEYYKIKIQYPYVELLYLPEKVPYIS